MDTVKRDFNGVAHFFLGWSLYAVMMAIIRSALNIGIYRSIGIGNINTLIMEIVLNVLKFIAIVYIFKKKPVGLIALIALFCIPLIVTAFSPDSGVGNTYLVAQMLCRGFMEIGFAIALCFKKNGISGWKSMLASKNYVMAHTKVKEATDASSIEQTDDQNLPKDDAEQPIPAVEEE